MTRVSIILHNHFGGDLRVPYSIYASRRAMPAAEPSLSNSGITPGEHHLLYVACTRARNDLVVTGVNPASEFLDDLTG
jgi:superfamily I DNA/RNA helicase